MDPSISVNLVVKTLQILTWSDLGLSGSVKNKFYLNSTSDNLYFSHHHHHSTDRRLIDAGHGPPPWFAKKAGPVRSASIKVPRPLPGRRSILLTNANLLH